MEKNRGENSQTSPAAGVAPLSCMPLDFIQLDAPPVVPSIIGRSKV